VVYKFAQHLWACEHPFGLEKSQLEVTIPSDLQVFMSIISVRVPKLELEKSQWEVLTLGGLQVFTSLVGMQTPKLDPEKSQHGRASSKK